MEKIRDFWRMSKDEIRQTVAELEIKHEQELSDKW